LRDAEFIGEACLRIDPVLDGDDRKIAAPRSARLRIDRLRPRRAEAAPEIVDADDKEAIGVERLAWPDHVVPPADIVRLAFVPARDMVRRVERVADQNRIGALDVERAVGLERELEARQRCPAGERQRRVEMSALRDHGADRGCPSRWRAGAGGGCGERSHAIGWR
jgi:hypothetical protein